MVPAGDGHLYAVAFTACLRTGRSRVVNDWQLTLRTGCNSTSAVLLARRVLIQASGWFDSPGHPAVLAADGRHAILML